MQNTFWELLSCKIYELVFCGISKKSGDLRVCLFQTRFQDSCGRSCEINWSLMLTPTTQRIIAQSLLYDSGQMRMWPRFHLHGTWRFWHMALPLDVIRNERMARACWYFPMLHGILWWWSVHSQNPRISCPRGSRRIALKWNCTTCSAQWCILRRLTTGLDKGMACIQHQIIN